MSLDERRSEQPEQRRIVQQLELLRRTSLAITAQLDRDALLKTILEQAVTLLEAEGAGIYEYHSQQQELLLVADHFRDRNVVGVRLKLGEGMAGKLVADRKRFMIIDDYAAWGDRAVAYRDHTPFGAVIEVPLTWQSEIIGVLYVDDQPGRTFTKNDAELLRSFADQAAIALVTADLVGQNKQRLERLQLLSSAGKAIINRIGAGSLDDVLELITSQAAHILNAEACGILLVKRPGYLSLEASYGHRPGGFERGKELPIISAPSGGLTGHIAYEGRLLNICGEALANHFARRGEPPHAASGECRSLLAVPLIDSSPAGPSLVGLLRVDNKLDPTPGATGCFSQEDEWVVTLFADVVIAAINSARLVGELEQQRNKSRQLIADSPYCVVAIDLHGTVTEFNDQAAKMLGYEAGEIINRSVARLYADPEEPRRVGERLSASPVGRLTQYQTQVRSNGGEIIPIRLAASWLTDDRGRRVGSVGFFEDLRPITEIQHRLELLLNAANLVAQAVNLEDGLQRLSEMIVSRLDCSLCAIFLLYENDACLLQTTWAAAEPAYGKIRQPTGERRIELSEWPEIDKLLRLTEQPLIIEPMEEKIRWSNELGLHANPENLILIALRAGSRPVGLLCLGDVRGFGNRQTSGNYIEPVTALADQTAVFIERIHLLERTRRRKELLQALDDAAHHMRAEKHPAKLMQEIVRLAVELVKFTGGGLYVNQPKLRRLERRVIHELPPEATREFIPYSDRLFGRAAQDGELQMVREYALPGDQQTYRTGVALPLKSAGTVQAVLFLVDGKGGRPLMAADREILSRYAEHAALALHTSRLLNLEQRMYNLLRIQNRISSYFQATADRDKVLHVMLTAATAGYSLGFNRAAILLWDDNREMLVGQMGIGQMEDADARSAWKQDAVDGLYDLQRYFDALDAGLLRSTPLDERVREIQLPLGDDLLQQVISGKYGVIGDQAHLADLPAGFATAFEPAAPIVIAPLMAQDRAIGLIIADNKFTQAPITPEDLEALSAIAGSGALTLDKIRETGETIAANKRLQLALADTGTLLSKQHPRTVLEKIVEQARTAAGAVWVSVILLDRLGQPKTLVTTNKRIERSYDIGQVIRPDGISARVMREGKAYPIADVAREQADINSFMRTENVRAALCMPFVGDGQAMGVMWLHFDQPRRLPQSEVDMLQLYVNQAALAYSRAQQYEELKSLQDMAQAMAAADGLPAVLSEIVEKPLALLQADSTAFWLYDAQRQHFLPESSRASGIPDQIWEAFRRREPRPRDTAYDVLEKGWLGVEDIADTSRYPFLSSASRRLLQEIGVRSYQALALVVGQEKLGVLFVNYQRRRTFDAAAEAQARAFANHAALALKKAQLLENVRLAHDTARVVADLSTLDNLESTLKQVVEGTRTVLDSDAVVLYAHDPERARFHYPPTMSGVNLTARVQSEKNIPPNSIVVQMMALDEPHIVDRVRDDANFNKRRFAREEGIISCAAIPLRVGSQKVGVMFVNYRREHRLTGDQLTNLKLFANQAAVAIQSAQLFEKAQRRARVRETLSEASRRISESLELPEILSTVVEQTWRLTSYASQPAQYASLLLLDGNHLCVESAYPANHLSLIQQAVGLRNLDVPEERGVTGRALLNVAQSYAYVPDVSRDAEYIPYDPLVQSELAIPLRVGPQSIGVLNIEHVDLDAFDKPTREALVSLAAQAAIAIQNARAHEEAGIIQQVSASVAGTLEWERVLSLLLGAAMELTHTNSGSILFWDAVEEHFADAYTISEPDRRPMRYETTARPGGLAWTIVHSMEPIVIPDCLKDNRVSEVAHLKSRRALIGVPLVGEAGAIGALYVNSTRPRQFTDHQKNLLRALGNQVAAALERVRHFEELRDAQGMVGNLTAELWQSMASEIWSHEASALALTISGDMRLLRDQLSLSQQSKEVERLLDKLESQIRNLGGLPNIPPLSDKEGVESIPLHGFLQNRIGELQRVEDFQTIDFQLELHLSDSATVRASTFWLRYVIDILVKNACEAMTDSKKVRRVTVSTARTRGGADITFQDTGCGVRIEHQPVLFRQRITGTNGMGKGLWMARHIMRVYRGEAALVATGPSGTTMALWLPLE